MDSRIDFFRCIPVRELRTRQGNEPVREQILKRPSSAQVEHPDGARVRIQRRVFD